MKVNSVSLLVSLKKYSKTYRASYYHKLRNKPGPDILLYPASTIRLFNIVLTSNRRNDVSATLTQHVLLAGYMDDDGRRVRGRGGRAHACGITLNFR